jgi:lysozyme
MRIKLSALSLFTCLSLVACTSGPAIEALQVPPPSNEITSSVVRPSVGVAVDRDAPPVRPNALAAVPRSAALNAMPGKRIYGYNFSDAKPINFGTRKPQHLAVHGVDVSRWQGDIDWKELRSHGANFAYIKATDGGDHLDPMFHKNWRGAADAGIKRGAYHFFYWCRTAAEQAEWFIRNVPKEKGALPPVIDVEWNHQSSCKVRPPRSDILDKIRVFSQRLERHYGQRPIIYTAPDFYEDNLQGAFTDHPFWLRAVAEHPSRVYPGRDWVFWQYSGSGLSGGVDGKIDLNVFHGDEATWWRWVGNVSG